MPSGEMRKLDVYEPRVPQTDEEVGATLDNEFESAAWTTRESMWGIYQINRKQGLSVLDAWLATLNVAIGDR